GNGPVPRDADVRRAVLRGAAKQAAARGGDGGDAVGAGEGQARLARRRVERVHTGVRGLRPRGPRARRAAGHGGSRGARGVRQAAAGMSEPGASYFRSSSRRSRSRAAFASSVSSAPFARRSSSSRAGGVPSCSSTVTARRTHSSSGAAFSWQRFSWMKRRGSGKWLLGNEQEDIGLLLVGRVAVQN